MDAMTTTWNVPGLPFAVSPSPETAWTVAEESGTVTAMATPHSDIFIDPGPGHPARRRGDPRRADPARPPPDGDFQFSARVTVDFTATYDAGVLLLWVDERHWGKLCFEFSPDSEPMIVSVVARGVADDANAFVVDTRTVWLRVSRIDHAFAYHASVDGRTWRMVRYFTVDGAATATTIGLEAQSPTGDGCRVTFDDIRFTRDRLADLRDGS